MSTIAHPHQWLEHDSPAACAQALADAVAQRLRADLAEQVRVSLAVSGGTTPAPFLEALSRAVLDWDRVDVTLVDERWVMPDHADSNERLVRESLITRAAGGAALRGLWRPSRPDAALAGLTRDLGRLANPFSAVVLGMGSDGHTASLFPETPDTLRAEADLVVVTPTSAPHPRVSLTIRRIAQTRALFLHITGADKRAVIEQALAGEAVLPIRAVFDAHPVTVFFAP